MMHRLLLLSYLFAVAACGADEIIDIPAPPPQQPTQNTEPQKPRPHLVTEIDYSEHYSFIVACHAKVRSDRVKNAVQALLAFAKTETDGKVRDCKTANTWLKQTRRLVLRNVALRSTDILKNFTQLKSLTLSQNSLRDISALKKMTELRFLDLNHNRINAINALVTLAKLNELILHDNQIEELDALAGLPKLEKIIAFNNRIRTIAALAQVLPLRHLELGRNHFNSVYPLRDLKHLEHLELDEIPIIADKRHCPIADTVAPLVAAYCRNFY